MSSKSSAKPLIVHVCPYYPPHVGGTEVVVERIANELAKRGNAVHVLTSNIGYKAEIVSRGNLTVEYLKSTFFANTPFMPSLISRLNALPQNSIMHIHAGVGFIPDMARAVALRRNIPYVVHFHLDIGRSGAFGWLLPIYKNTLLRKTLQKASTVIVLTEEYKTLLQKTYGITAPISVVPNGVDESFFIRKPAGTAALHKPAQLLNVGRLSSQKRVHILVQAVQYLKHDVVLTLIGDGEKRSEVEVLAKEINKAKGKYTVRLVGFKKGRDVVKAYKQADLFLLSSEREGLPLVLIEAMAAGVPIVASDVLGTRSFVKGTGILVYPATPQAFAEKIDEVLSSPSLRAALIKKGKAKAKKHLWKNIIDRIETIYKNVKKNHAA